MKQRCQIEAFIKTGTKRKKIAEYFGFNPLTISRELKRNTAQSGRTTGCYLANNAQPKTVQRQLIKSKSVKFNVAKKKQAVQRLSIEK